MNGSLVSEFFQLGQVLLAMQFLLLTAGKNYNNNISFLLLFYSNDILSFYLNSNFF